MRIAVTKKKCEWISISYQFCSVVHWFGRNPDRLFSIHITNISTFLEEFVEVIWTPFCCWNI